MALFNRGRRKFLLASVSLLAVIAGLFSDQLTGTEFLYGLGAVLALYGGTNVVDKSYGGEG